MKSAIGLCVLAVLLSACGGSVDFELPDMVGVDPPIVEAVQAAYDEVRSSPSSSEAWGALADRLRTHQWRAEAAECYARAEQLEPDNFTWPYRIGMSLRRLDQENAAAAIERAMKIDGAYAPAHEKYASIKASLGETESAKKHYETCVKLAPEFSHCHLGLGKLAYGAGELEPARQHLEQALRHNQRHAEVRIALSQVYLALGFEGPATQHADASRTLPKRTDYADPRSVSSLPPAGAKANAERGALMENLGQEEEAEKHYREAIRLNPEARGALFNLGLMLARRGDFDESISMLARAVELKNSDVDAVEGYARVLFEADKHDEAFEQMQRVLEIDLTRTPTRLELGQMLRTSGRDAEAAEQFAILMQERPRWAEPVFQLAWLRATTPDDAQLEPREALRLAEKGKELSYSVTARQHDIYAAALAANGRYAAALTALAEAQKKITSADSKLAKEVEGRLALYRTNTPYREAK